MIKFKIKVSELMKLQNLINKINNYDIKEIQFLDDNKQPIVITESIMDDWKFTGLNNTDLITSGFYRTGFDQTE